MKKWSYLFFISIVCFVTMLVLLLLDYTIYIDSYSENIRVLLDFSQVKTILFLITNIMSIIGILIIMIATIYFLRKKDARKDISIYMLSIFSCFIITNIIKLIIQRTRPLDMLLSVDGYSFPSSHASISVIVYGYLALLIYKYSKGKRKNIWIFLSIMMIFLTGLSRIYFNVHYITDVIAGFSLGLIVLCISNYLSKRLTKL